MAPLESPTIWAQKYGVAREKWLQRRGKSGISPQQLFDVYVMRGQTAEERKLRKLIALYQATNFEGLVTANMICAGAIGEQIGIRGSNLTRVHPLFRRTSWLRGWPGHLAEYPLGHGREGFWTAGEEEVWMVLKPCLALASRFMNIPDLWYWWDAQAWTNVFPSRPSLDGRPVPAFAFWSQHLDGFQHGGRVGPNRYFQMVAENVRFAISSGRVDPETGMPQGDGDDKSWDVKAIMSLEVGNRLDQPVGRTTIFVAYERLAPLLFNNLTCSEVLVLQFEIGIAIVQELAHMIHQQVIAGRPRLPDMNLEYKRVPELGESLINMTFGGLFESVTERRNRFWHLREKPTLAIIFNKEQDSPPQRPSRQHPRAVPIQEVGKRERYPVHLTWISDIQQTSYWDEYIKVYGEVALLPNPLTYGVSDLKGRRPERSPGDEDTIMYDYQLELDEQSTYTKFLVRDALARSKRLFGGEEEPRAIESRVLRTELVMEALFKTERVDQLEAEWNPTHALNSERAATIQNHRLIGQTREAVQLDQRRDRKFDKAMEEPPEFDAVLSMFYHHYSTLNLSTMLEWIPVPLLLGYITENLREGTPRVTIEALYDFLTYCEVHRRLFRFKRRGAGLVRCIRYGWPPQFNARIPFGRLQPGPPSELERVVEFIIQARWRLILDDSGLHDYAEGLLYKRFMEVVKSYRGIGSLPGGHTPPYELNQEDFVEVLGDFARRQTMFALGPPGIYRKIPRGWLGDNGEPGMRGDSPSSESENFTSDSDAQAPSDVEMTDAPQEQGEGDEE